nr:DegT/DnrJ/EryC1/StrS family aminotransferase [uncultured Dyadobacter sp.]
MNIVPQLSEAIQMVDLKKQYLRVKPEVDSAIQKCIDEAVFIKGSQVGAFEEALAHYLNVGEVVSCANGTDALQVALMSLDLKPGDEVIVPAFTYVAAAEVIALLGLKPVMVDVNPFTFNLEPGLVEEAISPQTKAVVAVHLFGQCADMESISKISNARQLYIVEDNAQSLGARYRFSSGEVKAAGSMGHLGTTSFFPSKNLGCFGDGGAIYTDSPEFAKKIRSISNHGQVQKYKHDRIGVNSRLDTIQAAILLEKLKHLDEYTAARQKVADSYDRAFADIPDIDIPQRVSYSTHVYNQYTIKVPSERRDGLKAYLQQKNIPSMIYYPLPLSKQQAFQGLGRVSGNLAVAKQLCQSVISLPIHTELSESQLEYICEEVKKYFGHSAY